MPMQTRGGRPYSARFSVDNAGLITKAGDTTPSFSSDAQKVWPLPATSVELAVSVGNAGSGVRMYQTAAAFTADGTGLAATQDFVEILAGGAFSSAIEATQLWFRSIDSGSATVDLYVVLKG